jgi:hypothetical protein
MSADMTVTENRHEGIRGRIDRMPAFLLVFLPLAAVYFATATYGLPYHIDPYTNAVTGWHLGMTGSVVLDGYQVATEPEQFGNIAWVADTPRGPVSQYPPGAAAMSAPLYRLFSQQMTVETVHGFNDEDAEPVELEVPNLAPATITAVLVSAAAMGLIASTLIQVGASRAQALAAGWVAGLGTTMWAVASDQIWQHGPAAFWVSLGVYLAARDRFLWSGLAFGAAILTRPHLALIAAAVGIGVAVARRSLPPVLKVGAGSLAGLGLLFAFNWWVWDEVTLNGGYRGDFAGEVASGDVGGYLENLGGGLFDASHGLLVYSPFLIVLIPGLWAAFRRAPDWARSAAVGGLIYLLVQWKANRFSGGEGFTGYRYPLEALAAAAVVFFASYRAWVAPRPLMTKVFWVLTAGAMVFQVV